MAIAGGASSTTFFLGFPDTSPSRLRFLLLASPMATVCASSIGRDWTVCCVELRRPPNFFGLLLVHGQKRVGLSFSRCGEADPTRPHGTEQTGTCTPLKVENYSDVTAARQG